MIAHAIRVGRTRLGQVGIALLLAMLMVMMNGCARTATPSTPSTSGSKSAPPAGGTTATSTPVPTALSDMESHAEDLYDTIYARNWSKAATQYAWFNNGMQQVDSAVQDQQTQKQDLRTQINQLGAAIKAKKRQQALLAANQISWKATQMTEPYHPTVPIAVAHLDYLGRQLQIWANARNTAKLQSTALEIQQTWHKLRPQVIQRGGTQEAQQFDQLVTQLQQAKTPAQYGKLAAPILDAVDNLEQVFTKPNTATP